MNSVFKLRAMNVCLLNSLDIAVDVPAVTSKPVYS